MLQARQKHWLSVRILPLTRQHGWMYPSTFSRVPIKRPFWKNTPFFWGTFIDKIYKEPKKAWWIHWINDTFLLLLSVFLLSVVFQLLHLIWCKKIITLECPPNSYHRTWVLHQICFYIVPTIVPYVRIHRAIVPHISYIVPYPTYKA